jgi:hypothetical protein
MCHYARDKKASRFCRWDVNNEQNDPILSNTHELLVGEGYKLIDDAWKDLGRRTYAHDDNADRDYIKGLARLLQSTGWQTDSRKLRTFRHPDSHHEMELEPGGSEVNGHFLHHMRANHRTADQIEPQKMAPEHDCPRRCNSGERHLATLWRPPNILRYPMPQRKLTSVDSADRSYLPSTVPTAATRG